MCVHSFRLTHAKRSKKYFFLATKNKRFFCHLFSGLCTILRSEAGGQDDVVSRGGADESDYRNNSHLLPPDGGRTTWATTTPRPSTLRAVSRLSRFFSPTLHSDGGAGGGQPSRETQGETPVPVPCPPCPRPSPPRDPPCFLQNQKSARQLFVIVCVVCHCE